MKRLILLGCNAGHWDYRKNNMAAKFLKKIKGICVASDGTVSSIPSYCNLFSEFSSLGDVHWRDLRTRTGRKDNKGWLIYKKGTEPINLNRKTAKMIDLMLVRKRFDIKTMIVDEYLDYLYSMKNYA